MKRPSREEYERAVAAGREAIQAHKNRSRIRADRSPQALVTAMQARLAKGEVPTEADLGALHASLAEQEVRQKRGRGRPKGTRDVVALEAFGVASFTVQRYGLHPYRNGATGHRYTQCDAIAEAMRTEGFRTLATYDAAAGAMKQLRRDRRSWGIAIDMQEFFRRVSEAMEPFNRWAKELNKRVAEAMEPFDRQTKELNKRVAEALGPSQREIQELGKRLASVTQHIRAQSKVPPKTRHAIEKHIKTKR